MNIYQLSFQFKVEVIVAVFLLFIVLTMAFRATELYFRTASKCLNPHRPHSNALAVPFRLVTNINNIPKMASILDLTSVSSVNIVATRISTLLLLAATRHRWGMTLRIQVQGG